MYPQVFGKYVLERELARGGMARVVLATLRGAGGFEKKMVVKQIRDELACDDEFIQRFVLEANTTVKLAHPNIVPVYELGVERGTYFLAMEFVEGASLAELLRAAFTGDAGASTQAGDGGRSTLSPDEVAYVGVEVCRALDYAHRRMNVVHRDVTPRNVMVDEEGQVKVIDFGIAAPVATAPSGHGVFGSPGHMPPEQMEAKELTPAADVFAVAVLLMELWSGKAPFRRRTREDIEAAMRAPHPRPSDANIRLLPLDDVIASAMALDPAARPQQAEDLGRALRRFLAGVDLGDVARQLGDRVRELRLHPPLPPEEPRPVLQRPPSRPTATQVGTKTFAAREGVSALSAPAPAPAMEAPVEVSTRRIESAAPAKVDATASHVRAESLGPATARIESAAPAPKRRKEDETVATTALETETREAPARRQGAGAVAAIGAAVLAVGAFFLGRAATSNGAGRGGPAAEGAAAIFAPAVTGAAAAVTAAAAASAPDALPPAPVGSAKAAGSVGAAPPEGSPLSSAAPAASLAAKEKAQLVLVGDGTLVSVDGVPRGACPARVAVEPGSHTVVFSFPATGESKGETLTLRVGEHTTLHADFTGAAPSIRVQRP